MTPPARHAAAIDILDRYVAGESAERLLTSWARSNRYAGSKDRAAVRDIVFDIIRKRRSCGAMGGGECGRALVLGYLRLTGQDPARIFTGEKYAPDVLTDLELAAGTPIDACADAVRLDYPDWLEGRLRASLGGNFRAVMTLLQTRAPVFVRVNVRRAHVDQAIALLAADQITAKPHPLAEYALEITENPRKLALSRAYLDGVVELQDVASQAVVEALNLPKTGRILDYCAGGGGKALAMAARSDAILSAYDIDAARMRDVPKRAKRAGVDIACLGARQGEPTSLFDFVLCDVPCSGSGAWRRSPVGKFSLTEDTLNQLLKIQSEIIDKASKNVKLGGRLAYSTCSILTGENMAQIERFLAVNQDFTLSFHKEFLPIHGGDGLFVAEFMRVDKK